VHARVGGAATPEAATNKLFRAVHLELAAPGSWQVEIEIAGKNGPLRLAFPVDVAEPVPPWIDLALWIGWPFAVIALFLVHQVLLSRRTLRPAGVY
jgi:hypothetical protein